MKVRYTLEEAEELLHTKSHQYSEKATDIGTIIIEGPLSSSQLKKYDFHEGLTAFRPAQRQFEAILEIADLEEGRIIIARKEKTIIGYVTYLYPDPLERWSYFNMENLIELGAIEVAADYRGFKLASELIRISMMDEKMEDYIVFSTEYYWHWDLEGTKISIWDYRKVMEKMMFAGGLTPAPTDDPEITSHPANCLMVRIGRNVPEESVEKFNRLRFLNRNTKGALREGF